MRSRSLLRRDERGAAAVEMAFALPALVIMLWALVQLAQVYRAVAGMQQALGEGARYATLCIPDALGCTAPNAADIKTEISNSVYGVGPGTFTVANPVSGTSSTAKYYDLTVSYSQPTNLLLLPGPTISLSRSKRVWLSTSS